MRFGYYAAPTQLVRAYAVLVDMLLDVQLHSYVSHIRALLHICDTVALIVIEPSVKVIRAVADAATGQLFELVPQNAPSNA